MRLRAGFSSNIIYIEMTAPQSVVKLVLDDNNRVDVNLHGERY